MKREEEIQKLIDEEMGIDNYGSCDFQVGVIYGVKHADKTMIEKACKWLEERLSDNITYVPETFYGKPKPVISEKGLEDFIKYLEE